MRSLSRIVVFLLLVALPFQVAIGATGWHCLTVTHHVHLISGALAVHDHSASASSKDIVEAADAQNHPGSAGLHLLRDSECSACSSCCFAAAIIPTTLPSKVSYSSFKININVDAAVVSPALDGLFRPPRSTTL